MDCLRPGDVAILTTHAAFRPHLEHVDRATFSWRRILPPTRRGQWMLAGEAAEKNLKIGAGLMPPPRAAGDDPENRDAMGDIQLIRAYRMDPGCFMGPSQKTRTNSWRFSPGHPYQFMWSSEESLSS